MLISSLSVALSTVRRNGGHLKDGVAYGMLHRVAQFASKMEGPKASRSSYPEGDSTLRKSPQTRLLCFIEIPVALSKKKIYKRDNSVQW